MDDIYVARLMSTPAQTVTPDTLVEDAATIMLDNEIGSVVVTDPDGTLEGILTSTDFVSIVSNSQPKAETTVSAYMTKDVFTTSAQTSIRNVADEMVQRGIHHVPVVDGTEGVIGIITTKDLTGYISEI